MPNLPADLPEDWTSNQKISPNGTEVGLSEQHGYNYLMQQVNAAQTAINNITAEISGALEGVAQETTSQSILTDTQEIISTLGGGTEQSVTEMLQILLAAPKVVKNIQIGTINGGAPNVELVGFSNLDNMFAFVMGSVKEKSRWTVTTYYIDELSVSSISFTSLNGTANLSGGKGSYVVVELY